MAAEFLESTLPVCLRFRQLILRDQVMQQVGRTDWVCRRGASKNGYCFGDSGDLDRETKNLSGWRERSGFSGTESIC